MTTVGIVGGLGPESTIDYYRRILAAWEARGHRLRPFHRHRQSRCAARPASRRHRPAGARRVPPGFAAPPRRRRCRLRRDDGQHTAHRVRRARGPVAGAAPEHRRGVRRGGAAARAGATGAARHALHDGGAVLPGRVRTVWQPLPASRRSTRRRCTSPRSSSACDNRRRRSPTRPPPDSLGVGQLRPWPPECDSFSRSTSTRRCSPRFPPARLMR